MPQPTELKLGEKTIVGQLSDLEKQVNLLAKALGVKSGKIQMNGTSSIKLTDVFWTSHRLVVEVSKGNCKVIDNRTHTEFEKYLISVVGNGEAGSAVYYNTQGVFGMILRFFGLALPVQFFGQVETIGYATPQLGKAQ